MAAAITIDGFPEAMRCLVLLYPKAYKHQRFGIRAQHRPTIHAREVVSITRVPEAMQYPARYHHSRKRAYYLPGYISSQCSPLSGTARGPRSIEAAFYGY